MLETIKYSLRVTQTENTGASFNLLVEANDISDVRYGLLVVLALSSLTVYGLILAG